MVNNGKWIIIPQEVAKIWREEYEKALTPNLYILRNAVYGAQRKAQPTPKAEQ